MAVALGGEQGKSSSDWGMYNGPYRTEARKRPHTERGAEKGVVQRRHAAAAEAERGGGGGMTYGRFWNFFCNFCNWNSAMQLHNGCRITEKREEMQARGGDYNRS